MVGDSIMSLLKLLGFLRQATPGVPDSLFCEHHGMYAYPFTKVNGWAVRQVVGEEKGNKAIVVWTKATGPPVMGCPLC